MSHVKLGNAYGFVLTDETLLEQLRGRIKGIPVKKYRSAEIPKKYLLSYFYSKEKSYLLIWNHRAYYYINSIFYYVPLCMDFKSDVIFEGDITEDCTFLISDIHSSATFQNRLKSLNDMIDNQYRYDPILDPFQLYVTDYVAPAYVKSFTEDFKPGYKAGATGWLVLTDYDTTPIYSVLPLSFTFTFDNDVSKTLAPVDEPQVNLMCFKVQKTDLADVYQLYLQNSTGEILYYDIACVPDKITSNFLSQNIRKHAYYLSTYHTKFKRWQPIRYIQVQKPDSIEKMKVSI